METPDRADHGERFVIVLNRTQDVVNIATSLRAMMNMGLTRLRLVRPDDFSAYRIAGIAHGSEALIERIEFFDSLDDAVRDASLVLGTTARRRTATYLWSHPREAMPQLLGHPATPEQPIAIVFGREDTGLLNEELDRCDRLLVVPTSELNSSLNLAQAVLLIGYELLLASSARAPELPRPRRDITPATSLQLKAVFEQTEAALEAIDFFKGKNPEAIMRTVRAVLRRAELTEREATLLRAMGIETQKHLGLEPRRDVLMTASGTDEARSGGAEERGSGAGAVSTTAREMANGGAAGMSERGPADYPVETFASRSEWREWLERNHASARGVWVRFAKKGSGIASVTYAEALDVALCYGWIDGQSKGLDETTYLQKFTPRGRRSVWSKRNREHVERLIALGEMQPAGLAAIEAAQRDGRWDRAYDSPATAEVPADLAAALKRNAKARKFFETLKGQNRYAILHRIQTAVRPETRARRIAQFVEMLERGETIH